MFNQRLDAASGRRGNVRRRKKEIKVKMVQLMNQCHRRIDPGARGRCWEDCYVVKITEIGIWGDYWSGKLWFILCFQNQMSLAFILFHLGKIKQTK